MPENRDSQRHRLTQRRHLHLVALSLHFAMPPEMLRVISIVALLLVVLIVMRSIEGIGRRGKEQSSSPPVERACPYVRKRYLLSKAEAAFFTVLKTVIADAYLVMVKVRMEDLLLTEGPDRWRHRNRVKSRHIDFVLCTSASVCPVLAIELDDSTHRGEKSREADRFKDDTLCAAGLPLLRVRASTSYDAGWLSHEIAKAMASGPHGLANSSARHS